jgi:hypothetical protein
VKSNAFRVSSGLAEADAQSVMEALGYNLHQAVEIMLAFICSGGSREEFVAWCHSNLATPDAREHQKGLPHAGMWRCAATLTRFP